MSSQNGTIAHSHVHQQGTNTCSTTTAVSALNKLEEIYIFISAGMDNVEVTLANEFIGVLLQKYE